MSGATSRKLGTCDACFGHFGLSARWPCCWHAVHFRLVACAVFTASACLSWRWSCLSFKAKHSSAILLCTKSVSETNKEYPRARVFAVTMISLKRVSGVDVGRLFAGFGVCCIVKHHRRNSDSVASDSTCHTVGFKKQSGNSSVFNRTKTAKQCSQGNPCMTGY